MAKNRGQLAIVTSTFPPRGGSGVQRVASQCHYLSEIGWHTIVLTTDAVGNATDQTISFQGSVKPHIVKLPVDIGPPCVGLLSRIDRCLRRKVLFPDEFVRWAKRVIEWLHNYEMDQSLTVLLSVGSPSVLKVAQTLRKCRSDLKLLIDFRDFWALNQRSDVPPSHQFQDKSRARLLEESAIRAADAVVVVSEGYRSRLLQSYPWLSPEQTLVVENGFIESDFCEVGHGAAVHRPDCLTVRYIGFLLRDHHPATFFGALALLRDQGVLSNRDLKVEFVGGNPGFVKSLIAQYQLQELVTTIGYVSHKDAISLMVDSDALYLPFADGTGTIGAKTYEYIRSRSQLIPVLGDCDEPRKILRRCGVDKIFKRKEVALVARWIMDLVKAKRNGVLTKRHLPDAVWDYTREAQTKKLDNLLLSLSAESQVASSSSDE